MLRDSSPLAERSVDTPREVPRLCETQIPSPRGLSNMEKISHFKNSSCTTFRQLYPTTAAPTDGNGSSHKTSKSTHLQNESNDAHVLSPSHTGQEDAVLKQHHAPVGPHETQRGQDDASEREEKRPIPVYAFEGGRLV